MILMAALMASGFCFAEPADAPKAPEANAPKAPEVKAPKEAMPEALKARLLREFDKDKDGYLNKEELQAAKKVLAERQAKFEEMQKRHCARIIKKYDKDGDGKLSEEELIPLLETQMRMLFEARGQNGPRPQRPDFREGRGKGPAGAPPPPPAARDGKTPPPPPEAGADNGKTPPPPPPHRKAGKPDGKKAGPDADRGPRGEKGRPRPDRERAGTGRPEKPRPEMRRPTEADLEALAKPETE